MPVTDSASKGFKRISIKPLHIKGAERLYFSSIITEFSDSWNPRWTAENVYGRMDPVSFYGGTSRELSLGFRVVSDDAEEAKSNMGKIQKLIQYQYPSYTQDARAPNTINAPPYFEFQFLNILQSSTEGSVLTGYINGAVQINPGFQTREQAQYFNANFNEIYFSDVTIGLRIQVLHQGSIGWELRGSRSSNSTDFSHKNYPYGIDDSNRTVAKAPASPAPQQTPDPEDPTPAPDPPPDPPDGFPWNVCRVEGVDKYAGILGVKLKLPNT
tara:strand:- start:5095 stop:5904 length:810 start_codon:yes stop_codon:yes gene_type:complete